MWFTSLLLYSFAILMQHKFLKKNEILIKFGNSIRDARKSVGISQEELADKAGLHRTYIGMIERAEKNITLINIEKLAIALSIDISELLKNNS